MGILEDRAEAYLNRLKARKTISKHTEAAYRQDMEKLFAFAREKEVFDVAAMDASFFTAFWSRVEEMPLSVSSKRRLASSLSGFFKDLQSVGALPENLFKDSVPDFVRRDSLPARVLSEEETNALLKAPGEETFAGRRDTALLALLCATGIRASEAAALTLSDADLQINFLRVREPDGGIRHIPFDVGTGRALTSYIRELGPYFTGEDKPLFVSRTREPLSRQSIWKIVKKNGHRAGIAGEVSPRTLRETFTARVFLRGAEEKTVQSLLGVDTLPVSRYAIIKSL